MNKKLILLTLKGIEGIGNVTARKITDGIDKNELSVEDLYLLLRKIDKNKISDISVVKNSQDKALEILRQLEESNLEIITYLDKDYPKSLLSIKDPPAYLFYSGNIKIASEKCVAVVGTRHPSIKGKDMAYNLSVKLCKNNIIVSGLAEGIDTEAHKATIENKGKTIAILGHGLDIIFPLQNKELAESIVKNGGLIISEYPLGQGYSKFTFVARNRLQSALSDKVFIIESEENGGTMYTAKKAKEQGKEVWVFRSNKKGYILPSGNNRLIKEGAKIFDEDLI